MQRSSFLVGASVILAGCARRVDAATYQTLGPDAQPLRGRFNQDEGKVRILMLVSPT
jgi:hypothetical protein